MTQDIDERAKINKSRSVAAMIAIGVLNIITVPLLSKFGSHSAKTGYLTVAVIYGCIFTACHFFCFAKTKESVITPEKEKISVKVQLKAFMQNSVNPNNICPANARRYGLFCMTAFNCIFTEIFSFSVVITASFVFAKQKK